MSIFQSLNVGVSGLQSQSNMINIISDNLANANTVGYKRTSGLFSSLVINSSTVAGYSPGGAIGGNRHINRGQGNIIPTDSATDIAIGGNGFFAVRDTSAASGRLLYTRAGSFIPNENGDFINGAGFFLQGWQLDQNGNLPASLQGGNVSSSVAIASLRTVNPSSFSVSPVATTLATIHANLKASQTALGNSTVTVQTNLNASQLALPTSTVSLLANLNSAETAFTPLSNYDPTVSSMNMSSGSIPPSYSHTVSVIDNTGTTRTIKASFLKTGDDTWAVEISAVPAADVTQTDGQLAYGTVTFNPDGSLASASPALTAPVTADWNNPGGASTMAFNLGTIGALNGITQTDDPYTAAFSARPDYDPTIAAKSMASGAITPSYTTTVNVIDDAGTTRTLNISYLKTGVDTWAVEIYSVPASDVTTPAGTVTGQVAYGTATFNSNGTLATISPSLSNPIPTGWNNNATANNVVFNWTAAGSSTGLSQLNSAFTSTLSAAKNYDPDDITKNMSSGSVQSNFDSNVTIIDPAGVEHTVKITYLKTGINTWAVEVFATPATDVTGPNPQLASGIVTFNGDGTLASVSSGLSAAVPIAWQSGETNSVTFNWGTAGEPFGTTGATVIGLNDGLGQIDNVYSTHVEQNGLTAGSLKSVNITQDGFVVGNYDNGVARKLYKIPLALFIEANSLESITGNVFAQTKGSGDATFANPTQGAAGAFDAAALEMSTVDTSEELTNIIIAQRAYQANTKTITTSDEMLRSLDSMLG